MEFSSLGNVKYVPLSMLKTSSDVTLSGIFGGAPSSAFSQPI